MAFLEALKNSWVFPAVESVHLIAMALLVGTIVLLDLCRLRGQPMESFAAQLAPWTRRGLEIMVLTGLVMFLADMRRYVHNPAFLVKLGLLAAALAFHFTLHRRPAAGRGSAMVSLALWSLVALAGRAIADFDL